MAFVSIDSRDATPLHAQIERGIRGAIAMGRLKPGAQLPTVRQLAVDLRVNANTIARVYRQLEREGVLETRRGVGTFVAAPSAARAARARDGELRAFVERFLGDAASRGFSATDVLKHFPKPKGE